MSATSNTYVSPNLAATPDAPDIFVSKHTLRNLPAEIVIVSDDMVARFSPCGTASLIGTPLTEAEFDLALQDLRQYEDVREMLRVLPWFFNYMIEEYSKLVAEREADDVRIVTMRDSFKRGFVEDGYAPEYALKLADDMIFYGLAS